MSEPTGKYTFNQFSRATIEFANVRYLFGAGTLGGDSVEKFRNDTQTSVQALIAEGTDANSAGEFGQEMLRSDGVPAALAAFIDSALDLLDLGIRNQSDPAFDRGRYDALADLYEARSLALRPLIEEINEYPLSTGLDAVGLNAVTGTQFVATTTPVSKPPPGGAADLSLEISLGKPVRLGNDIYDIEIFGQPVKTRLDDANVILDGEGGTRIDSGSGNDLIVGGAGDDSLDGGDDRDYLHGGSGNDFLSGGVESDHLSGGGGQDFLSGDGGDDIIVGGEGIDAAHWQAGRLKTKIDYTPEDVTVTGREGTDILRGVENLSFIDGTLIRDETDPAAQLHRLYGAALGRTPEMDGLKAWIGGLNGGVTLQQAAEGFMTSPEFQARYGTPDDASYVTLLYNNVLGRDPEPEGLRYWTQVLAEGTSRATMLATFSETQENLDRQQSAIDQGLWVRKDDAAVIARLYDTVLDRVPDEGGLIYWLNPKADEPYIPEFANPYPVTLEMVAGGMMGSPEFQQKYGSLNDTEFVTQLYRNVLDREPEPFGLLHWVGEIGNGVSRESIVLAFSESPEHVNLSAPKIDNGIWLL